MIPGVKKSALDWNDVMMYLSLIGRHFRLMTLLLCFSLLLGLTYYVFAKPVYYSRALVSYDSFALPNDDESVYGRMSIFSHLGAPHILERALAKMGIHDHWDEIQKKHIKKVKVRGTSLGNIEIEVWPYNKGLIYQFPQYILEEYLLHVKNERAKFHEQAVDKWEREKDLIEEKLKHISDETFDFKNKKNLLELEMRLKDLKRIPPLITQNNYKLQVFERFKEQLERDDHTTVERLSLLYTIDRELGLAVGDVIESPTQLTIGTTGMTAKESFVVTPHVLNQTNHPWEQMDRQRRVIEAEIAELEHKYLPAHPIMAAKLKELEDIERKLSLELEMALTRFDLEYRRLLDKQSDLTKRIPEYEAVVKKHDAAQAEFRNLTAGQLSWSGLYATMAKSLTSLEWGAGHQRTHFQYMGLLEVRELPVSPHRLKLAVYSLMLGLALAIGVPLLLEYLDHTVTNVEQAEVDFDMRALGIVPQVIDGALSAGARRQSIDSKPDRHLLENFRVIRTNLLSSGSPAGGSTPQVIMVASALPQEGKSLVSANLALSFAQMGEKTLLIDADLRRGRLHRAFRVKAKPGLGNVLMGGSTLEDALQPTKQKNLTLLPYGKHAEGITELLGSENLGSTLTELRTQFQRIILDTPPALGLSDAAMLQPVTDGVVFVIWSKRTSTRSLKMALQALRDNGANIYGFILNRLDLNDSANYYHFYYYSSYYYQNYQIAETVS